MLSAPQSVNVTHLREDFSAALLLWLELLGSSLTSESLSPSPALGTLSSIALNGGEGRGEEALIKTFDIPAPAPSRHGIKSPLVAAPPPCVVVNNFLLFRNPSFLRPFAPLCGHQFPALDPCCAPLRLRVLVLNPLRLRFCRAVLSIAGKAGAGTRLQRSKVHDHQNNPGFFHAASINPEFASVEWPGEVDLCPQTMILVGNEVTSF